MVLAMATATISRVDGDEVEERRRALMAESDCLLDDVETLRLDDHVEVPQHLREAIRSLQVRLGRSDPPLPPSTLHAAHDLVFAVQQRLMAANPEHPRPNRHAGRPGGQPVITLVRENSLWKLLALPPPPSGEVDEEWLELVECTVERAWDRWCYAQQLAMSDRPSGRAHPLRKKLEECAQAIVVERGRGYDDAGRRAAMRWLQNLREVVRKVGWQVLHHAGVYGDRSLESKGHAAGRDRGCDLGAEPRRDRKEPPEALHGPAWHRDVPRASETCGRGHRVVLGRRHQRHRHRFLSPLRPRGRPHPRQGLGAVVDRRAHEHRPELPRPPPRSRVPRQGRAHLGG